MLTNFKAWTPVCVLLSAGVVFSFEVTPAMHAGGQTEPEAGERKDELPLSCSEHIHTLHPGIHRGALGLVTRVNYFLRVSQKFRELGFTSVIPCCTMTEHVCAFYFYNHSV